VKPLSVIIHNSGCFSRNAACEYAAVTSASPLGGYSRLPLRAGEVVDRMSATVKRQDCGIRRTQYSPTYSRQRGIPGRYDFRQVSGIVPQCGLQNMTALWPPGSTPSAGCGICLSGATSGNRKQSQVKPD